MKQLLIGAIIGVAAGLLLGGTAVYAQWVELPWTKNIYTVSDEAERMDGRSVTTVSMFDRGKDTCYVVRSTSNRGVAISCVKRGDR